MPILTSQQYEELQNILGLIFRPGDLVQLMQFKLSVTPTTPGIPNPLSDSFYFDLIGWLEKRDRTDEFLVAVKEARPRSEELKQLCQSIQVQIEVDAGTPLLPKPPAEYVAHDYTLINNPTGFLGRT